MLQMFMGGRLGWPLDSLARGSGEPHRSRRDRRGSPDDHLRQATDAKGQVKGTAADANDQAVSSGTLRTMDCVDCHNTVGHPISPTAERMVDRAIAAGEVSSKLPRREGVRLVTASYASQMTQSTPSIVVFEIFMRSKRRRCAGSQPCSSRITGCVSPQRVSFNESHVGFLSREQGPHRLARLRALPRRRAQGEDGSAINGDCDCHREIQK